jgi:hypothetical protein
MSSTTNESLPPRNTTEQAAKHQGNGAVPPDELAGGAQSYQASPPDTDPAVPPISIAKPTSGLLDRYKSDRGKPSGGVETLRVALPHHKLSDARDFVRLHSDEENWWSDELCFVNVPIKGQKRDLLHMVDRSLLPPDALPQVLRFRLALASKPYDLFFLCHIPSQNLDNKYNSDNLRACEMAKTRFVKAATDRSETGAEGYVISSCRDADAFPDPKWPSQTLEDLITLTFGPDRTIDREDHPALLRLLGKRQSVS